MNMWWVEEPLANFKGFNLSELNSDEAFLNVSSTIEKPLWMYILSKDCHTCSFQKFIEEPIIVNHSYKAIVNTQHGLTFRLRMSGESNFTPSINDSFKVCDLEANLGEFGVYSINVQNDSQENARCFITNDLEPVNTILPIFTALLFWLFVGYSISFIRHHQSIWMATFCKCLTKLSALFYSNRQQREEATSIVEHDTGVLESETESRNISHESQGKLVKRKKRGVSRLQETHAHMSSDSNSDRSGTNDAQVSEQPSTSTTINTHHDRNPPVPIFHKERLKSLDAFRGLCILIMIFVDDGGGGYYFLQHCTWDGLYVADLAFPWWFLWICGVSIPFSMQSRISNGTSKAKIFREVLIRSVKLISLGIMVNTSTKAVAAQLEYLRIPGVLQRFGISYLIGSMLLLLFLDPAQMKITHKTSNRDGNVEWNRSFLFQDFKNTIIPWVIVFVCLGLHTILIFFLPVPGCQTGYLGPAGLHSNSAFSPECVGGAAGYIDRLIFGTDHIHKWPTSKKVYLSGAFDPEGTLGVLTSILHIWLGIQTGMIFITYKNIKSRLVRLLSWSAICGCGGFILCGGISNSGWIPVNKNLWSLSFVLVTSSAALAIFSMFFVLIDVYNKWHGSPLVEAGRNSILLYLAHEICHAMIPWHFSYGRMRLHSNKLMETSWGTFLWIAIAVYLHGRRLFFVV